MVTPITDTLCFRPLEQFCRPFKRNEFLTRIQIHLKNGTEDANKGVSTTTANDSGAEGAQTPPGGLDFEVFGRAATTGSNSSTGDGGGRVILCIDDDAVSQVVLQGMLRSQSYRYLKVCAGWAYAAVCWLGAFAETYLQSAHEQNVL